jgi:hypothetical protein
MQSKPTCVERKASGRFKRAERSENDEYRAAYHANEEKAKGSAEQIA